MGHRKGLACAGGPQQDLVAAARLNALAQGGDSLGLIALGHIIRAYLERAAHYLRIIYFCPVRLARRLGQISLCHSLIICGKRTNFNGVFSRVFSFLSGFFGVTLSWCLSDGEFDRKAEARRLFQTVFAMPLA
jgi:hypothetical protein